MRSLFAVEPDTVTVRSACAVLCARATAWHGTVENAARWLCGGAVLILISLTLNVCLYEKVAHITTGPSSRRPSWVKTCTRLSRAAPTPPRPPRATEHLRIRALVTGLRAPVSLRQRRRIRRQA